MYNVDNLDKWVVPQPLLEYLPYGMMGYDNEGSPGKIFGNTKFLNEKKLNE